MISLLFIN